MSILAARFDHPVRIRASHSGEPGSPDFVEHHFPCVGCWEETLLVGALKGEDHETLIHIEQGEAERRSRAYYCAACWARDVEPRILESGDPEMVTEAEASA